MYCPKCGTLLQDDSSFCTNCGSAIKAGNLKAGSPKKRIIWPIVLIASIGFLALSSGYVIYNKNHISNVKLRLTSKDDATSVDEYTMKKGKAVHLDGTDFDMIVAEFAADVKIGPNNAIIAQSDQFRGRGAAVVKFIDRNGKEVESVAIVNEVPKNQPKKIPYTFEIIDCRIVYKTNSVGKLWRKMVGYFSSLGGSSKIVGKWVSSNDSYEFYSDNTATYYGGGEANGLACKWIILEDGRIKIELTNIFGGKGNLVGTLENGNLIIDTGGAKEEYKKAS